MTDRRREAAADDSVPATRGSEPDFATPTSDSPALVHNTAVDASGNQNSDVTSHRQPNHRHPESTSQTRTRQRSVPRPTLANLIGTNSHSTSRSPSTAASPHSSRDSSPAGRVWRQQSIPGATASQGMRSRKNSHDQSPHRPPSVNNFTTSVPSAAAIQRALSAATTPQLQPATTSEPGSRIARPAKSSNSITPSEGSPSWPVSPRLKSPPPSGSRRNSLRTQKKPDAVTPNIVIQNPTPSSSTDTLPLIDAELDSEPRQKPANRGASGAPTLETVQEASGPNTPGNGLDAIASNGPDRRYFDLSEDDHKIPSGASTPRRSMAAAMSKSAKASNSGSDEERRKAEEVKEQENDPEKTPRPKNLSARPSFSSLRQKTGAEPAMKSMTVETETVNSVGQISQPSDRVGSGRGDAGTLRAKASNDTIKPGKSRKKASRKQQSINATSGMYPDFAIYSPPCSPPRPVPSPARQHHLMTARPPSQQGSVYARSEPGDATSYDTDRTVVAERPGTLRQLRHRSSQLISRYFSNTTSLISPTLADYGSREASTRADIFEDRVKNAMDEATSDDSDETFVYESNPPEQPIRRSRGHHSRTPSATSLASMGGPPRDLNMRPLQTNAPLTQQKTRSMKFANAYNSADDDPLDRQDGTIRAGNRGGAGNSMHHHTQNRPSRNAGHTSILDEEGPFPQLNKVRSLTGLPGRQTQNARIAARNLQASGTLNSNSNGRGFGSGQRKDNGGYQSYDLDAEGGDDERTPLIQNNTGTVRTPRNARRPPTRGSRTDHRYPRRSQSMLTRFAGCIAIVAMIFLLVFGIVGFLFIITTPLQSVSIQEIQSVLASESEIMFDLQVGAVNPNLLPITVGDMDMNVFAKSRFVGSEKWWRENPGSGADDEPLPPKRPRPSPESSPSHSQSESVDSQQNFLPEIPGSWPEDDGEDGSPGNDTVGKQTMLLGRVYHFDNPLVFDASFLKRHVHTSTGAVRISKPGNRTELGGSERWERVLLHEFELIVRGTLKYSIPLGGRAYAANVAAKVTVDPASDDVPNTPPNGTVPDKGVIGLPPRPQPQKLKFKVTPLNEDGTEIVDTIKERLRRRVCARVLRQI